MTPWLFDETARAEDWAYLLYASRPPGDATMRGARALARRLARAVAEEHDAAIGWVGISRACPFDLHRLVPVPPALLHDGWEHPAAQRWLAAQWGTTWPLRQVVLLAAEPASWEVAFWSADWSPWPALARIRKDWPDLTFRLTPLYANDGADELAAWRKRRGKTQRRSAVKT